MLPDSSALPPTGTRPGLLRRVSRARPRIWVSLLLMGFLLWAIAGPVAAIASYRCWTAASNGAPVLRCRVGGVDLMDFGDPGAVGVALHAGVGEDVWGECWFSTEVWSGWTTDGDWAAESAALRYDVDGTPGGYVVAGAIRRCSTDPAITSDERAAMRVLRAHEYARPDTDRSPRRGVVGLPTYLGLAVPDSRRYGVGDVAGNEALLVEVGVAEVRIDWGDGSEPIAITPDRFADMKGYPDGTVRHGYQQPALYRIEVGFKWTARWRVSWDPKWYPVAVGTFAEVETYAVDQIVGRVVR